MFIILIIVMAVMMVMRMGQVSPPLNLAAVPLKKDD